MWRLNVSPDHLQTCVENEVFGVKEDYSFEPNEILLLQLLKRPGVDPNARIKYFMRFVSKKIDDENATLKYWGTKYNYLVKCKDVTEVNPFSLENIQKSGKVYSNSKTANRVTTVDEQIVMTLLKSQSMKFWWVNQNKTYVHEVEGGYMWSPKTKANGAHNQFYVNMTKVRPGDIVFSFAGKCIPAIGIIRSSGYSHPKPSEFGNTGKNWKHDGWCVDVEYHELLNTISPEDHIEVIRPTLPKMYSPLQNNGRGNQGAYLAHVPEEMAEILLDLIGPEAHQLVGSLSAEAAEQDNADKIEATIKADNKISNTEKEQLVKSRRGQGVFRTRLERIEKKCRLTGVTAKQHLRASHIKPWSKSTNEERLDGENGLLLSPHIDHLFDIGYISFNDDGTVLTSSKLNEEVVKKWGVDIQINIGTFTEGQKQYLAYHREQVFLR